MPDYKYIAKTVSGKTIRGTRNVTSEAELYRKLRDEGLYLDKATLLDKPTGTGKRLKHFQISDFCQQLGTLLRAGITLVRALSILTQEEGLDKHVCKIYELMVVEIRKGNPLSTAMEQCGNAFPPLLINMFKASEGTGNIDKTAERMAVHYDKEYKLNKTVKSAMTYPMIVFVMTIALLVLVITFVLPQFESMFEGMELPAATRFVLALGDAFKNYWPIIIVGTVLLVFTVRVIMGIPLVRLLLDTAKVKMPKIGVLMSTIYTARFARTLSSLYSCGMPIIYGIQVSKNTIGNAYIARQFDKAVDAVRSGEQLSKVVEGVVGVRRKLSSAIFIGEETGNLDTMLNSISDSMEYESEQAIQKLVKLLEPIMLIFMAVVVAGVVIAVLMPIFNSYSLYGGDIGGV